MDDTLPKARAQVSCFPAPYTAGEPVRSSPFAFKSQCQGCGDGSVDKAFTVYKQGSEHALKKVGMAAYTVTPEQDVEIRGLRELTAH